MMHDKHWGIGRMGDIMDCLCWHMGWGEIQERGAKATFIFPMLPLSCLTNNPKHWKQHITHYMYMYICIYVYIYVRIWREAVDKVYIEREREREYVYYINICIYTYTYILKRSGVNSLDTTKDLATYWLNMIKYWLNLTKTTKYTSKFSSNVISSPAHPASSPRPGQPTPAYTMPTLSGLTNTLNQH